MTDVQAALPTRSAVEVALQSKFADIAAILTDAVANPDLYPVGLPASLDRAMRFSANMAAALQPAELEPETDEQIVASLCTQVDAERERRTSLDFAYDFGETLATDDAGEEIEAGVRQLQMRPGDRANWQALQGAALTAVVSGQQDAVLAMRAEDNWNIQTTALQVLQVLAAMIQQGAALLFYGGALKSAIRSAEDPTTVEIEDGWPE